MLHVFALVLSSKKGKVGRQPEGGLTLQVKAASQGAHGNESSSVLAEASQCCSRCTTVSAQSANTQVLSVS